MGGPAASNTHSSPWAGDIQTRGLNPTPTRTALAVGVFSSPLPASFSQHDFYRRSAGRDTTTAGFKAIATAAVADRPTEATALSTVPVITKGPVVSGPAPTWARSPDTGLDVRVAGPTTTGATRLVLPGARHRRAAGADRAQPPASRAA